MGLGRGLGMGVRPRSTGRHSSLPSLAFDFIKLGLDSRITYTGSGGTYFNSAGVLTAATTNQPRFDYNPATLAARGLLIEGQRTNLLLRSTEFDNASWTKTDTTITANAGDGPRGAATMDLCTEGTAGTAVVFQSQTVAAGQTFAASETMKRGNHDWIFLQCTSNAGANGFRGWFNLATGAAGATLALGTGTVVSSRVEDLGGGAYRCIVVGTVDAAATSATIVSASASANSSVTRVNNGTRYQDMAQLEVGANATSFIPTTTAQVTRTANIDSSTAQATSARSVCVEATTATGAGTQTLWSLNDGTANERIYLQRNSSNEIHAIFVDGGVTQADLNLGTVAANTTFKAALAWGANDIEGKITGSSAQTDTSATLPTVTTRNIGHDYASANHWNGHVKSVTEYRTRQPSATLAAMVAA